MTTIIGIDRGQKHIGLASAKSNEQYVYPIGCLSNDSDLFFALGGILYEHNCSIVVVGLPRYEEQINEKIKKFAKNIKLMVSEDVTVVFQNEDYSSVQANARREKYQKDFAEDTISAMIILEEYLQNKNRLT